MKPKVSVIMPIYNSAPFLEKCISSVTNQTYANLEIILINDGSTDRSLKICKTYQKQDDRIKLINKTNTGVSDSRNIGIEKSTGKYIMFVDSDDCIEKTMVEEMVNCITTQNVDVVRCRAILYDKTNNRTTEDFNLHGKYIVTNDLTTLLSKIFSLKSGMACYIPTFIIKKDKIVKFNTNLTFMEDTDFVIRLLHNINSIYFLDKSLYHYTYNEKSITKNVDNVPKNINQIIHSTTIIENYLDSKDELSTNVHHRIHRSSFYLIASKLYILYANKSFHQSLIVTRKIFNNDPVHNFIIKIQFQNLKFNKKVLLFLLKLRAYFVFSLNIKILLLTKNLIGKQS